MDRRTKILAIGFGAVLAYVVLAQVVYPNWIRPLVTIDERIAEKRAELDELEELQKNVDKGREQYRDLVARIGSFDARVVETAIRDRINTLIEKHKLENASVVPARPAEDRKTGITTGLITVTAVGTLESAVNFMKDASEFPELVRIGTPQLSPAGKGRKEDKRDLVNLRVPIEMKVLPQNKIVGRIEPATLPRTENFVRHAGRDYSEIWARTPFTPHVDLPPLSVNVVKVVNASVGDQAFLQATPSGGEGNYTISWSPTDGIREPNSARTPIDTSVPRTETYTVTVTDTAPKSTPVTATVTVNIKERPQVAKVDPAPPPPPPPPPEPRDPDRQVKQIVMTLMHSTANTRTNELMVNNSRSRQTSYYKIGDEMDGGKLLFVHQTGGLVHRMGKYYVYPLGMIFEHSMEYQQAADYPELRAAAERAIALQTARAEADRKKTEPAEPSPEDHPVTDSRGGPGPGAPALDPSAGPIFPLPGNESPPGESNDVMGPPDQTAPAPSAQNQPAAPGARTPGPNQPPRQPASRPRPKNKGRL